MDWLEDTINRELREFIIQVAKGENLDYSQIRDLLAKPISIENKITPTSKDLEMGKEKGQEKGKIRKRKIAPSNTRCVARLLKEGHEHQCSNSYHSSSQQHLCGIHMKSGLPYGTIHDEIPLKYRVMFKQSYRNDSPYDGHNDAINTTDISLSDQTKPDKLSANFDLSLFPKSLDSLTEIKIGGGHFLEDQLTGCLYQKNPDNLYYVGKLNGCHITRF